MLFIDILKHVPQSIYKNCINKLKLAYKLNTELFFSRLAAWKIIKAWLPEDFVEKIKFVRKTDIQDYVSEDNLPVDMGGTVSIFPIYVYIFD